ncbi:MAG: DMT family transporter [Rhodospirillales bacterium]|nr:DMT family transporter [Rhodospirillales bacterium]
MGTSVAAPSLSAAARRHAIICVLSASATFSFGAAVVKALTESVPILEIVVARSLVGFLAMLPVLWRQGGLGALATRRPGGHVLRTLYGFVGTVTTIYGYTVLPLATVTALGFAMPLCLTALSVPLLGERVGWRRASAVLVGFAGVMIMLRPWRSGADSLPAFAVAAVLAGVVAWALAMISIRRMGEAGEKNVTIVAWYSLGTAQLLMTEGYRAGEATLVAPFEYGAIIYATLLGLVFWGEWPDQWSLLGVVVLVGAGLYIWRREVTLGLRR